MRNKRLWLMGVLVVVALAALVGAASSAVGFSSGGLTLEIRLPAPAKLMAKGAAVQVPVQIVCTSSSAYVRVQIVERVGNGDLARSSNQDGVSCKHGAAQDIVITMPAAGKAFDEGTAFVRASIQGCARRACGSEQAEVEIPVVGGRSRDR